MGELDKDYKKLKELAYGIIILAVLLLIAFLKMGTTSFVVAIPIYLLFRFKYHIRFYKILQKYRTNAKKPKYSGVVVRPSKK